MQPGLSPGVNKTDVDFMHDQCEVSLKRKAIFQAPLIVKLLPARMQGIFKTTFTVKDPKINYGDTTHRQESYLEGEKILLVPPQSNKSGQCSWQYSSKLKLSTVKVMSLHRRGVVRPCGVSSAKLSMDRLGNSATLLYLISDPHS